ncbi:hypothetical protein KGD83_13005 [Nocardiopsis akebiae]|uniref:MmyB-like transcription regulator ligand binding domain-containing protein n=2 Tax=Nocardiopsis akebiae TaxID=2831968 RepID=A0ABX8CA73_9ACTN|nr:hypothetical protein [Nocardiopsis akebiae]QUX31320.1 hypothetical protein KGD83_13005 [Nocardiopsis akebiae]
MPWKSTSGGDLDTGDPQPGHHRHRHGVERTLRRRVDRAAGARPGTPPRTRRRSPPRQPAPPPAGPRSPPPGNAVRPCRHPAEWWRWRRRRGGRVDRSSSRSRWAFPDTDDHLYLDRQETVAMSRGRVGTDLRDPRFAQPVEEPSPASEAFRRAWARHDVRPSRGGLVRVGHPQVGAMDPNASKPAIDGTDEQLPVVYHPHRAHADGLPPNRAPIMERRSSSGPTPAAPGPDAHRFPSFVPGISARFPSWSRVLSVTGVLRGDRRERASGGGAVLSAPPSNGWCRPALNLPGIVVSAGGGCLRLCTGVPLGLSAGGMPLDAGGTHRTGAAGRGERVGDGAGIRAPGDPVAASGPYPGAPGPCQPRQRAPTFPCEPERTTADRAACTPARRPGSAPSPRCARTAERRARGPARVQAATNLHNKGRASSYYY